MCSRGVSTCVLRGEVTEKVGDKNRITALLPHLVRHLFNPTNTPGGRKICVAGFKAQNTSCSSRDEGGLEDLEEGWGKTRIGTKIHILAAPNKPLVGLCTMTG